MLQKWSDAHATHAAASGGGRALGSCAAGGERAIGVMVLLLTIVLLLTPVPLSNVAPAMVISLISLAYVEEDGLLLSAAFLAGIVLIGIGAAAVWGTIGGAVLISA